MTAGPGAAQDAQEIRKRIELFLAGSAYAVAGASRNRAKYGNKVLRAYRQHGYQVFPINPSADEVEGLRAYPDLSSLPRVVYGVSVVTPPAVSLRVVEEAIGLGIEHVWLQPGAESEEVIRRGEKAGINLIAGGP